MSEKDVVSGEYRRQNRIIRKVVFTYRLEGDPEDVERTWTLEHGGAGEVIDGIIWNEALMTKLAYQEQDKCRAAEKRPGKGDWKRHSTGSPPQQRQAPTQESQTSTVAAESMATDSGGGGDCFWLHDENCWWSEYCIG